LLRDDEHLLPGGRTVRRRTPDRAGGWPPADRACDRGHRTRSTPPGRASLVLRQVTLEQRRRSFLTRNESRSIVSWMVEVGSAATWPGLGSTWKVVAATGQISQICQSLGARIALRCSSSENETN